MKYDIVIVGGGTAGCACAYNSAKLGLKTLLIEKNAYLGGTMTSALVFPAMKTNVDENINFDFYELLMKTLHNIGGQITYADGNIGWFNPELMKNTLHEILSNIGVDILLNSSVEKIVHNNNHINGLYINNKNIINIDTIYANNINLSNKMLSEYIETTYLVDGTGDAKIFEKLNLKFLNNFENIFEKKYQPVNLRFIMSGINLKEFSDWIMELDSDRNVTTSYTIDGQIHLSTAYTWDKGMNWALTPLFKEGIAEGLITEEDSNYFQVFTIPKMPDSIGFNCPRIVKNIDPTDIDDINMDERIGKESISRLSKFFKLKFKGFKSAYVSKVADSIGIRVSNRIIGKYIYKIDDLRSGKKFDNPCVISNYPVDVHSNKEGKSVLEKQKVEYMLPVESLISADFDNLFAIGRCLSADFMSQAALRIIPSCFAMGEGLAKYLYKLSQNS